MRHPHVVRAAALGLAVAAVAAPAASAQPAVQSPDASDANFVAIASRTTAVQSPDARDANQAAIASHSVAVQSPDARDANLAARGVTRPTPRFVVVSGPAHSTHSSGLHWGDAGLGAGGLLAFVAFGAGGVYLAMRRRPERPGPPAAPVA
jgi:hypothetical protein